MREVLRLGATLAVFCAVGAGAIAGVNGAVKATIEENNRLEAVRKRQQVFPAAKDFEALAVDGREVFVARGEGGAPLGLVVTAGPRGYAGPIGMTLGIAPDGTVAGLAISKLDQPIAVATVTLLGLIGLAAGYFPARRAASVQPAVALRFE